MERNGTDQRNASIPPCALPVSLVYMPVTTSNLEQLKSTTLCVCVCVKVNMWMWPDACVSALKIKDNLLPVHTKRKTLINAERAREKASGKKCGCKRAKRNRRMTRVLVCTWAGIADRERHSLWLLCNKSEGNCCLCHVSQISDLWSQIHNHSLARTCCIAPWTTSVFSRGQTFYRFPWIICISNSLQNLSDIKNKHCVLFSSSVNSAGGF